MILFFFEREKKNRKNRHFRHRDDQHDTRGLRDLAADDLGAAGATRKRPR
jgi:hypothetical protein